MSDLLRNVTTARDLRQAAEREWRRAMVNASEAGFSLRAIAREAGVHFTVVRFHLKKERDARRDS